MGVVVQFQDFYEARAQSGAELKNRRSGAFAIRRWL
jgi:hypothetical protein